VAAESAGSKAVPDPRLAPWPLPYDPRTALGALDQGELLR
jgi:hypothetical protein